MSTLCQLLEEYSVRYCLLAGSQNESEPPDIAIHPGDRDRLRKIFEPMRQDGYVVLECVQFSVGSYRFHFACLNESQVRFAYINIVYGYRGHGLRWESSVGLVQRRLRCEDHWGVHAQDEFAYWLGRISISEAFEDHHERRLKDLVIELGTEKGEECASPIYGEKRKQEIVSACAAGTTKKLVQHWKKELQQEVLRRHPINEIGYALKNAWRLARRWLKPSGLVLALLGPDGVGKSTTTAAIRRDLLPLCPQQREFHWRPQMLMPRPEVPLSSEGDSRLQAMLSQNRFGDPPRGFVISTARLLGVMLDYWIGYLAQIRAQLVRCGLIVFDRYYHDILVDSLRYRYGGPKWLLYVLRFALPPWNMFFIILDADEQVVYSRKQELTLSVIRSQRAAYRELGTKLPAALVLRTDCGLELCRNEALRGIVEYLAHRFRSSFGY